jgi:lipopolysaccharide transport system permease protein
MVPLNIPHYTTFLLTGILPWTWLQASLLISTTTVVENRELVRQVGFPVALLPAITVLSQLVHFMLAIPIVAAFMWSDGYRPGLGLAALPLVVLIQLVLLLSLAYIVATLQVKFRDTQYVLGIILYLFFYLTPVFWAQASIPEPYRSVMQWNPVAVLLNAYRSILMHEQWPDLIPLLTVAAGSMLVLALGYTMFSMARDRFVEEL